MAADNIAVMVKGQVVEQGTHHELVHRDGLYAAMVRAQDLGAATKKDATNEDVGPEAHEYATATKESDIEALGLVHQPSPGPADDKKPAVEPLTAETIYASVVRCAFIMLKENKDMYPWYLLLGLAYCCVGGTYAIQAVLVSRLIQVFREHGPTAQHHANFYALMLFVLALANLVGYYCLGLVCNAVGNTLTYRYRKEMLERILEMDQVSRGCVPLQTFANRLIGFLRLPGELTWIVDI